jgi:alpha-L-glutamate ligase-like protein
MHWIFGGRRLARLGILSMNRRNAACILDGNPRALFPIVDDKLRLRELCARIRVPTPEILGVVAIHSQLRCLQSMLSGASDFVIKPNRGSSGRGVLVVIARDGNHFLRHNGERLHLEDLRRHIADILSGLYSIGGQPDLALIQYRVRLHSQFAPISFKGVPDMRVIVYRGRPAMAMLRLPTRQSNGRANLHQGGVGAGIDLATGFTLHAVHNGQPIRSHPDTNMNLLGRQMPFWVETLAMSQSVAAAVGLGYLGVDIVIDAELGPMLLEANARPGLAIQIANGEGLMQVLARIDAQSAAISTSSADRSVCRFGEC